MPPYVKICGIRRLADALAAVEAGADALGFNFYPKSPRYIDPLEAARILLEVPPSIYRVGVFVNESPETVCDIALRLDLNCLQFHGDETLEYCAEFARPWIKVFRPRSQDELEAIVSFVQQSGAKWVMLDSFSEKGRGGTGERANWALAHELKQRLGTACKLVLAGGLTVENVGAAIEAVRPEAVDVASGVERSLGVKDPEKMTQFIERAKA